MSLDEMIAELNPMLRGWDNSLREADAHRKRIIKLNGFVHDRLRIFWRRKHNAETKGLGRLPHHTLVRLGLYQFGYS